MTQRNTTARHAILAKQARSRDHVPAFTLVTNADRGDRSPDYSVPYGLSSRKALPLTALPLTVPVTRQSPSQ